jgi:hypothetical protein
MARIVVGFALGLLLAAVAIVVAWTVRTLRGTVPHVLAAGDLHERR